MASNDFTYKPVGERVAVLETEVAEIKSDIKDIIGKLDELLTLKAKGMGAFGLVSIIVVAGSGIMGLIAVVMSFFNNRPHL